MQNLIQKLAHQADQFADKTQLSQQHPDWQNLRDEKFVEFVVLECCRLMNSKKGFDRNTGEVYDSPYNFSIDNQVYFLKEYFGL